MATIYANTNPYTREDKTKISMRGHVTMEIAHSGSWHQIQRNSTRGLRSQGVEVNMFQKFPSEPEGSLEAVNLVVFN